MTFTKSAKIIGASVLLASFVSGTAIAGDKKNCEGKSHTTAKSTVTQVSPPTVVLPASAQTTVYASQPKTTDANQTVTKVYTFDEALAKCQKYGATDLQACIDKKTGQAPKS